MRIEPRRQGSSGFALAWMLVLVAILALAGGAALQDALFAQQLGSMRANRQRALALAELGLRLGLQQLTGVAQPPAGPQHLHPHPEQDEAVHLVLRPGAVRMPDGFSAQRFIARDYEIQSTAHSARNAALTLVQGATRLEPVDQAAP